MTARFDEALAEVGLSVAEWAVLRHVADTVVAPRAVLAEWTADNLPGPVPATVTVDDCAAAIGSLLARGLLVELTADDIEQDVSRWRAEALPVTFGVHLRREPGDVDLTQRGADAVGAVEARLRDAPRAPVSGYADGEPGVVRAFGETEESCTRTARGLLAYPPAELVGASLVPPEIEPIRPIGPWWYSRFERVERGYEIVIRFAL